MELYWYNGNCTVFTVIMEIVLVFTGYNENCTGYNGNCTGFTGYNGNCTGFTGYNGNCTVFYWL